MKCTLPFAALAATLSLFALSACGSNPEARESKVALPSRQALSTAFSGLFPKKPPPALSPTAMATARAALEKTGQPIVYIKLPKVGYSNLMAPYGQNGPVATWASASLQSVSLQDGILLATRGFGNDLMTARAPDIAQVFKASGYFHRGYSYLDGADQRQFLEYDCTFAPGGTEQIDVLSKAYTARKVVESCEGLETSFENTYWFDQHGTLRQSDQRVSPQLQTMRLQRIVD